MRNVKLNNKDCCGCTACYSICTRNAIIMVEDGKGFKYLRLMRNYVINVVCAKKYVILTFLKVLKKI